MLINKSNNPKVIIVGNPNLMNHSNITKLMINYQAKLSDSNKQSVLYYALSLDTKTGKHKKVHYTENVKELKEIAENNGVLTIATTNPDFFKFATGSKHFMASLGKALDGINELDGYKIVPVLNFFMLFSQPQKLTELNKSVECLDSVLNGTYKDTVNILDKIDVKLIDNLEETRDVLDRLIKEPKLAMDIETTGLVLGRDRIITVALATSTTKGYAFATCPEYSSEYEEIREELYNFYLMYKGEQLGYNAIFDVPFILRDLMDVSVYERKRLNDIVNNWNITDVMHLKYLCVNGLQRVSLGLKDELFDIYGEYDNNIKQDRLLEYSFKDVGTYNVYDVTGTFEAYNKYSKKIIEEDQLDIFTNYYKPSLKTLIKMKYQGLIIDKEKLTEAQEELNSLIEKSLEELRSFDEIKEVVTDLKYNAMFKYNSSHVKQKTVDDFDVEFNPNSTNHKVMLLIDTLGYPVLETSKKTGNPSVGKDVMKQYREQEQDEHKLRILKLLQDITDASKVAGTFLKAFDELSVQDDKGIYRVHGDFKLHGTVSGRLSSSNPNLQNLEWWVIS